MNNWLRLKIHLPIPLADFKMDSRFLLTTRVFSLQNIVLRNIQFSIPLANFLIDLRQFINNMHI